MYLNVYGSPIYNSHVMETTCPFTDEWIHTQGYTQT